MIVLHQSMRAGRFCEAKWSAGLGLCLHCLKTSFVASMAGAQSDLSLDKSIANLKSGSIFLQ
jgi:hypothetical protein